ncbi:MAG: GNAT family N-acetyltransferase, partial [Candidatus Eisenbacteria bacterium]
MTFKVVYRPENLGYGAFKQVETKCFPDESIDAGKFNEWVTQDFWTVYGGDRFIGYGYLMLKPGFAWIARVGVTPGWRNKGVGNSLMETMIDYCQKHGRSRIILYVQQDNPSAIRLYRKFKFNESEVTYQYVIPIQRFPDSHRQSVSQSVAAVP